MKKWGKHIIAWTSIAVCLTACNSNDNTCHKERTIVAGVELYTMIYNQSQETFVPQTTYETLTIKGIGNDSTLYNSQSLQSFTLPLHILADTTSFVLQRDSIGADTLTIRHTNENNFISFACGCFVFHTITGVEATAHHIDSVAIVNSYVQNVAEKHLKIYYRSR